jgi:hypothetical protein
MSATLPLRVTVLDVWDEVPLELSADASLAELKRKALTATRVTRDPAQYVLKFRGFELQDESKSLADAGLVPNGAVIVMPKRRRPVR